VTRRGVLILLVVLAAGGLLWQPLLGGVAAFMGVEDPPGTADFVLPLYQDVDPVSAAVTDIYRAKLADRVVLYRTLPTPLERLDLTPAPHHAWQRQLEARGIPAAAFEIVGTGIEDPVELGRAMRTLAPPDGPVSVIVVVERPQSRVARNGIRRGLGDAAVELLMHPVTPVEVDERAWWRSRRAWVKYFDACVLWLVHLVD
jgi:hypothetical protein